MSACGHVSDLEYRWSIITVVVTILWNIGHEFPTAYSTITCTGTVKTAAQVAICFHTYSSSSHRKEGNYRLHWKVWPTFQLKSCFCFCWRWCFCVKFQLQSILRLCGSFFQLTWLLMRNIGYFLVIWIWRIWSPIGLISILPWIVTSPPARLIGCLWTLTIQ